MAGFAVAAAAATALVPLTDLWVPILLATVLVWVLSALFWTVSPHHKQEFAKLPNEDQAMAALRQAGVVTPGTYAFPLAGNQAEVKTPEFQKKLDAGPVGMLTITAPDIYRNMGKPMILSAIFYLVVTIFVAYVAGRTLPPGTDYLQVFRITGATAFLAYGMGSIPDAIWFGRPWSRIGKQLFDSLVYALFTAGVFGWRWPGA
jgi:hypothetical protein